MMNAKYHIFYLPDRQKRPEMDLSGRFVCYSFFCLRSASYSFSDAIA